MRSRWSPKCCSQEKKTWSKLTVYHLLSQETSARFVISATMMMTTTARWWSVAVATTGFMPSVRTWQVSRSWKKIQQHKFTVWSSQAEHCLHFPCQLTLTADKSVPWVLSCWWDRKTINLIMGAIMTCHLSPAIQMKCTSCCQSCQRALPTRVPNVPSAIRPSGGQRWRGSFRAAFVTSSLRCSTHAHPHTYYATDRLDTDNATSSSQFGIIVSFGFHSFF